MIRSDSGRGDFDEWFAKVCKEKEADTPYEYQCRLAEAILRGQSVVLRAPTGAGKTRAAVLPFLMGLSDDARPSRLIYILPMRTLAQGIHREAYALMTRARDTGLLTADLGTELRHDSGDVRLQTGEAPGDPFFSEGRMVVATFDQLLSGLLHSPYGLSDRLHNINGAAIAGSLVVFDEFHLMEISRAFMTAAAFAKWFGGLCQTVWMTATATSPVADVLVRDLGCIEIALTDSDLRALPSVSQVTRTLERRDQSLSPDEIVAAHKSRTVVICNTVGRAQATAARLRAITDIPVLLIHSRFFQSDRRKREAELQARFGKAGLGGAILVATQVVEAGLDLSCEHLWTEICPVNALIQRAGRCARFPGEDGCVHVRLAPSALPYDAIDLDLATNVLPNDAIFTPQLTVAWVEAAHRERDARGVAQTSVGSRLRECRSIVKAQVNRVFAGGVAHLIREADDSVFVLIRRDPPGRSLAFDRVRIGRRALLGALGGVGTLTGKAWKLSGWDESGPTWTPAEKPSEIGGALVVCLHPDVCRYDDDGVRVGVAGSIESTALPPPIRPGYAALRKETWTQHAEAVAGEAKRRVARDRLQGGVVAGALDSQWGVTVVEFGRACHVAALLHDLGKLQRGWQAWAQDRQIKLGRPCRAGEFLAHTDEGKIESEMHRPHHATASATGAEHIRELLRDIPESLWDPVLAAIAAHHGGWLDDCAVEPVEALAFGEVASLLGPSAIREIPAFPNGRRALAALEIAEDMWPLASIITRVVRLSDQRATSDWCANA